MARYVDAAHEAPAYTRCRFAMECLYACFTLPAARCAMRRCHYGIEARLFAAMLCFACQIRAAAFLMLFRRHYFMMPCWLRLFATLRRFFMPCRHDAAALMMPPMMLPLFMPCHTRQSAFFADAAACCCRHDATCLSFSFYHFIVSYFTSYYAIYAYAIAAAAIMINAATMPFSSPCMLLMLLRCLLPY